MASAACADSRAAASSASLAWVFATWLSTVRRILPHRSTSQAAVASASKELEGWPVGDCVTVLPPLVTALARALERVPEALRPTVGR